MCVHLSVHEKKEWEENERVFESVCVCVSVWFSFGFPETAHYFCEGFYLQSHCIHKCLCLPCSLAILNIRNHRAVVDMTASLLPQ